MVKEEEALLKAANAINEDKVPKKPSKTKQEKQTSNAKKEEPENRKELERWKAFVTKNNLGMKDQKGDVYLKVEAWNYLFAIKGVSPTILDMSRYEDEESGTLYIAKAGMIPISKKLSDAGVPLGATSFGACRVGEGIFKDDYSALSMAQTRAVGKLGRTVFGHLAIACGFKATPMEEMVFDKEKK